MHVRSPEPGTDLTPAIPATEQSDPRFHNYANHIGEMGRDLPLSRDCFQVRLIGANCDIVKPEETDVLNWEVALVSVIVQAALRRYHNDSAQVVGTRGPRQGPNGNPQ